MRVEELIEHLVRLDPQMTVWVMIQGVRVPIEELRIEKRLLDDGSQGEAAVMA